MDIDFTEEELSKMREKVGASDNNDFEEPELWDLFTAYKFPDQQWKIKDLIPYGGFTFIASPSGEFKTWIAMAMTKSLAFGVAFLNQFETQKSTVLYINQEMSKAEFQKRGKLLGFDLNLGKIWVLNRDYFDLNSDEGFDSLNEFVENNKIDVVILDTFKALAGNLKDDDSTDVKNFFQRFKPWKDKGISLIILDHVRKPERFDGKIPKKEQLFGSQYKVGSVEILLMLKKQLDGSITIHQLKNRTGKEIKPFRARFNEEVDENFVTQKIDFSYEGEFDAKESKKDEAKEFIIPILEEGEKNRQQIIGLLQEQKIGQKNTDEALREMEREGIIKSLGRKPKVYFIVKKDENKTFEQLL